MLFVCRYIPILLLLSSVQAVLARESAVPFEHFAIRTYVAEKIYIDVEVYFPKHQDARAMVIVSPNSGGLADPYFDPEIAEPKYLPDRRGGLTTALLDAGYAVAFYSQRGFASLASCVAGENFQARAASFVQACVSTAVRAKVSLSTITADTRAIYEAIAAHAKTRGLIQLALAYSEGMHHVSALAGQGLIKVAGIVGVGGPRSSLAAIWEYQMLGIHELQIAEKAFSLCSATVLNIDEIFACANAVPTQDDRTKMRALLGSDKTSREGLALRRQMLVQQYAQGRAHYAASLESEVMEGAFGGNSIAAAFSAHYYKEIFESHTSIVDQLSGYQGRTKFLFGEFDHLFPELDEPASRDWSESARTMPGAAIIPGVGHGLEDQRGFPTAHALAAIVQAIDEVFPN